MIPLRSTSWRRLCAGALFAASAALLSLPAAAEAPARQWTQAPGYYRVALGGLEVTALYDGYVTLDSKLLKGASAGDIQALLARMSVPAGKDGVQTAVNGFLVHTGRQLVLIDAGAANCFGPTLGAIADNIRAAGYRPEQVDAVLLTHLHGDHACGLTDADGRAVFANATVHVAADEAGFWLDPESAAKAPPPMQPFFRMAQQAVAPYVAAGRLQQFQAGAEVLPGIASVPLPGHTPGHGGYLLGTGGAQLLVWGDVVHSHAVQFKRPQVSIEFDIDQKQAIASRRKVLAEAAAKKLWIAGAHLPFPGIGHVRADGSGYAWVPAEYGPLPARP